MATELPKTYDPQEAQTRWLQFWEERGYNHSEPDPKRKPFTIVIPPPNVTGALHLGHALNNTIQDVLIRWRRMQGYNAEWIPGTDHAGIATQSVVERRILAEEKKTRRDLGREELVRRIWTWKDQYEKRILGQLRELGCSCDWQRTRFTLDSQCAKAVRETFFKMFRDGYIFRGKRLVNWDTQLQTSVADDETETKDTLGGFWTFQYPVNELPETFIRFSTTRPETMLGDTAVCVHPSDERYQHLVGKTVTVPLTGRVIPIIADALLADPELGTGCVKVTPAHDPNDYACGLRHRLPFINILNPDGTINEVGGVFAGKDRLVVREEITQAMDQLGYFVSHEERQIPLKISDRSKTPIEPYLSDQWFVRMGDHPDGKPGLAEMAIGAVTGGKVQFFPERYAKSYLDWLSEKRDWCISRQLWWGHRIPIWYCSAPESELQRAFAGRTDVHWRFDEATGQFLIAARTDLPVDAVSSAFPLRQDEDVLDTWFSSALWPHSTFGWPDATAEVNYYYPTSVLVTSRDIITLWVARMVMTGLYNLGEVPFHHVYVHTKILDGFGESMSKTKGNGVDPLDIITMYGTDALRFCITQLATDTQDGRLPVGNVCPHCGKLIPVKQEHMYMRTKKLACPECKKAFRPGGPWPSDDPGLPTAKQGSERFELGRNFANKLWNAARFILLNLDGYTAENLDRGELPVEDRWILSRLATNTTIMTQALENYRFSEATKAIYEFAWTEFCDWYIEMAKGRLKDPLGKAGVQRVLVVVLDAILRLVQPIMPFVAESLWQALNEAVPTRISEKPGPVAESVMIAPWPVFPAEWIDTPMETRITLLQELVRGVREVRNRYMLDNKSQLELFVRCSLETATELRPLAPFIVLLAGVGNLQIGPDVGKPSQAATQIHPLFEAYVSLQGLIDPVAEAKRIEKQIAEKGKQLDGTRKKLENADFVKRAPEEVVAQQREQIRDLTQQIDLLQRTLSDLQKA